MEHQAIHSSWEKQDETFEQTLRPQSLLDFMGQKPLREKLDVFIGAAKLRKEALGHCLFHGPPGLGKTTLANILAKSMGSDIVVSSGPVLEKPGDLAGILTNLKEGDIFFIDEIHRVNRQVEEYLYSAMEDFSLDLLIDSGPSARSVQVKLNRFTLVGATTRSGLLSSPMRSRFAFTCRLDFYDAQTLKEILLRSAHILKITISEEAALEISQRSRGTPRIANHLLKWVRDFAQMHQTPKIEKKTAEAALKMLDIDQKGLDEMDKKILSVIMEHYEGGPVGIKTLAVAIGEEESTIEEVYEPFLILQGFLKRTPRGREVTSLAYEHIRGALPPHKKTSGEIS
jgi:Holliday junction DNA helicase RuvB